MNFQGQRPLVTVHRHDPEEEALELRLRRLLEGRTVSTVKLAGDQCHILLDNGESLTMNCAGGFRELS